MSPGAVLYGQSKQGGSPPLKNRLLFLIYLKMSAKKWEGDKILMVIYANAAMGGGMINRDSPNANSVSGTRRIHQYVCQVELYHAQ